MTTSRRDVVKFVGSLAAFVSFDRQGLRAQSASGTACMAAGISPNPATVMPRMPLEEFVETSNLVAALRRGVSEMRKRKPSDPRSWFFQAAIHGVELDETKIGYKYYKAAAASDPDLVKVDRKLWNQCPHGGQNSANFIPWHRAYTFHFEQILREHTGDSNFSLPYWNYGPSTNRKFPKIFGVQHLDGDMNNEAPENINPLFLKERDFYLTYYEHPLIPNMPLLELTDAVVDTSLPMAADVFFGETETTGLAGGIEDDDPSTRGLLEGHPHDHIHRVVGGIVPGGAVEKDKDGNEIEVDALGAMAQPPTAGFDPIFSLHHTNIDRLWAEWACMPGKKWGKLPAASWFMERPWFFFDAAGNCINEPRRAYFDHRKLGVRFKYEDPNCVPLALPDFTLVAAATSPPPAAQLRIMSQVAVSENPLSIGTAFNTVLTLPPQTRSNLAAPLAAVRSNALGQLARGRLLLRVTIADLSKMPSVGFDLHVTKDPDAQLLQSSSSFVGSVNLFVHAHHGDETTQDFDITKAAAGIDGKNLGAILILFVPVALTRSIGTGTPNLQSQPLRVKKIEFLSTEQ